MNNNINVIENQIVCKYREERASVIEVIQLQYICINGEAALIVPLHTYAFKHICEKLVYVFVRSRTRKVRNL